MAARQISGWINAVRILGLRRNLALYNTMSKHVIDPFIEKIYTSKVF
jgi:hypothetical protein